MDEEKKTMQESIIKVFSFYGKAQRHASTVTADNCLLENSMAFLMEAEGDETALEQSDVDALKGGVEAIKSVIGDLSAALDAAPGKFDGTKSSIESLAGNIPDPGTLAGMIIDGDPKKISAEAEKINKGVTDASAAAASVIAAIDTFANEIGSVVQDLPDDLKEKTLSELAEQAASDEGLKDENDNEIKFPDLKQLKSGAQKAVKIPNWFQQSFQQGVDSAKGEAGGMMSAVGSFFKGLFGAGQQKGVDKKVFSEEIVMCTADELMAVSEAASGVQDEMTSGIEDAASGATQVQAGAEQAEETGQVGGGAEGGGSVEEDGEAAAEAAEAAAADAANKPLGAALGDISTAFAEPYGDNEKVANSLQKLNIDIKDSIQAGNEMIGDSVADQFQQWFDGLEQEEKDQIAPVAIKSAAEALKQAVNDNLKMENKSRRDLPLLSEVLFDLQPINQPSEDMSISESYDDEFDYTIDELVYDRWQRMSGVEGSDE